MEIKNLPVGRANLQVVLVQEATNLEDRTPCHELRPPVQSVVASLIKIDS